MRIVFVGTTSSIHFLIKHVTGFKMVGRGGRKARRLSLTRTPALFPLFRLRFFHRDRAVHTKGSDAVSVNKAPSFKNSKSGLRCEMEEPMFKSMCLS